MIIVTGATGFIGTYLVDQLVNDNVDVLATGRSESGKEYYKKMGIPFTRLDITREKDFNKLPKEKVDAVVHLAALLSIDVWSPKDYLMVNALGTRNVLEYCRKNDVKKIVYSMTHSDVSRVKDIVITEDTPRAFGGIINLSIPYIVSKIAAMNFLEAYHRDYGLQGISLRLPGVRGYGSRFISFWEGVPHLNALYKFIQKAMRSEPIEIWGEHKTVRDLIYIKDVVAGITCALNSKNAVGLYNIATGRGLTIEQEIKAIIKVFSPPDKPSKIIYRPDIEEVQKRSYIFDINKAKKELGYHPKYSYEDALRDYKKEMESGRFKHLVLKQEQILKKKYGKSIRDIA